MNSTEKILSSETSTSKFQQYSKLVTEFIENDWKENLYEHQRKAVEKVKAKNLRDEADRLESKKTLVEPIVVVAPTGSGKSGIIFLLPYVLNSSSVLIITPSKVITTHLAKSFGIDSDECFLVKAGVCPSDEQERDKFLQKLLEPGKVIEGPKQVNPRSGNLVIVNAQKFSGASNSNLQYNNQDIIPNVRKFFARFDTLIVDEAHHYPAETWKNILKTFRENGDKRTKKIIFLTATPFRKVEGKVEFILGPNMRSRIVYWIKKKKLAGTCIRKEKVLELNLPFKLNVGTGKPIECIKKLYRDIESLFQRNLRREPRLTSPQAMILVRRKKEARTIARLLKQISKQKDYATAIVAGKKNPTKLFDEGKFKVAVTCGVALEGYDNSNVTLCVVLRNIGMGTVMLEQFIGRCVRLHQKLGGKNIDRSWGIVLSYPQFKAKKVYENMKKVIAVHDPEDSDDVVDPNDDVVDPNDDVVDPNDDVVDPNDDVVDPNDDVVYPNDDLVESDDDLVEPDDQEEPDNYQEELDDDEEEPDDGQEEPGDDQEEPGDDQEEPGDDQEEPGDDQEEPGDDQKEPGDFVLESDYSFDDDDHDGPYNFNFDSEDYSYDDDDPVEPDDYPEESDGDQRESNDDKVESDDDQLESDDDQVESDDDQVEPSDNPVDNDDLDDSNDFLVEKNLDSVKIKATRVCGRDQKILSTRERTTKRPILAGEQKTKRPVLAGEQKTKRPVLAGEQKTKRPILASEQKTKRFILTGEQNPKRAILAGEQKTKQPILTGEQNPKRAILAGEQKTKPILTGEQNPKRAILAGEQKTKRPILTGEPKRAMLAGKQKTKRPIQPIEQTQKRPKLDMIRFHEINMPFR